MFCCCGADTVADEKSSASDHVEFTVVGRRHEGPDRQVRLRQASASIRSTGTSDKHALSMTAAERAELRALRDSTSLVSYRPKYGTQSRSASGSNSGRRSGSVGRRSNEQSTVFEQHHRFFERELAVQQETISTAANGSNPLLLGLEARSVEMTPGSSTASRHGEWAQCKFIGFRSPASLDGDAVDFDDAFGASPVGAPAQDGATGQPSFEDTLASPNSSDDVTADRSARFTDDRTQRLAASEDDELTCDWDAHMISARSPAAEAEEHDLIRRASEAGGPSASASIAHLSVKT